MEDVTNGSRVSIPPSDEKPKVEVVEAAGSCGFAWYRKLIANKYPMPKKLRWLRSATASNGRPWTTTCL
jgi:hypothetical protein